MNKREIIDISPEYIKDEFKNIFVENCGDKKRDMAICPDCEGCAYFDGYEISFDEMVKNFFKTFKSKLSKKIAVTELRKMVKQSYNEYTRIQ